MTTQNLVNAMAAAEGGSLCSLQESSSADQPKIWFGVDDADPQILAQHALKMGLPTGGQEWGWVPYAIPKEVLLSTRMHLNQDQVRALIPLLQHFVDTGSLPHEAPEAAAPDPEFKVGDRVKWVNPMDPNDFYHAEVFRVDRDGVHTEAKQQYPGKTRRFVQLAAPGTYRVTFSVPPGDFEIVAHFEWLDTSE